MGMLVYSFRQIIKLPIIFVSLLLQNATKTTVRVIFFSKTISNFCRLRGSQKRGVKYFGRIFDVIRI